MGFGRYIVVRILNAILVLVIATFLVSLIFSSVAEKELKAQIEEELAAKMKDPELLKVFSVNKTAREIWYRTQKEILYKRYGLDKPLLERAIRRALDQLKLNMGKSHTLRSATGTSDVSRIILEALPRTILLFTTATIIVTIVGLLLGLKAAQKAGSMLDKSLSVFALITYSFPMWWVGMLLIIFFSYYLGLLPSGGMTSIPPPEGTLERLLDILYHVVLPVSTAVLVSFGGWAYTARSVVLSQFQEDYVMAARAKGVPERKVLYKHVLRASAPPIVTMMVFMLLGSLGGAMISEIVFNWPGMGRLYWIALAEHDVPVLLGNTTFSIILYQASLVVMDLIYGLLDPRVKVGAQVVV
ncbi:MAG TPA: ABC transporter permease [Candidatus Korarchaeota archaeon]|nr:ABC transporter permease [Candidatus Korarchaeota archaeon]